MLIPRRVKHRKQHHPGRTGAAKGGTKVTFGDYGIQAIEPAYVTNRQIESARIAMTRHIKRGGKVWIYKGDSAGSKAERDAAQAAARMAQRARPARATRPRRDDATGDAGAAEAPAAEATTAPAEATAAGPTSGTEA
jgi:ribosomal protein L16